jgi:hypothetical protein
MMTMIPTLRTLTEKVQGNGSTRLAAEYASDRSSARGSKPCVTLGSIQPLGSMPLRGVRRTRQHAILDSRQGSDLEYVTLTDL